MPPAPMPPKLDQDSDSERLQIVAPTSWIDRIDQWRSLRRPIPSRSEAIRTLVLQALDSGRTRQK